MRMMIVTVSFGTEHGERAYDLEIPGTVPASVLRQQIGDAIREYSGNAPEGGMLYVRRLERSLAPDETPDQAGIWNGDILEIR